MQSKFVTVALFDIRQELNKRVSMLVDEMGLSSAIAQAILLKQSWDVSKAKDSFLDEPGYL